MPDAGDMALGALIVFAAAFLGGVTGFGYALAAAPLLLLTGFPLRFVVTANLALGGLTRLSIVYRFRRHISWRRSLAMGAASVPGLYVGARVLSDVPESAVKLLAGCAVMATVVLLARSLDRPPPEPIAGAPLATGLDGWAEKGGGVGNSLKALGTPATAGAGAFGGVLSTPYVWVFIDILVTLTIGCLLGIASQRISAAVTPKR